MDTRNFELVSVPTNECSSN